MDQRKVPSQETTPNGHQATGGSGEQKRATSFGLAAMLEPVTHIFRFRSIYAQLLTTFVLIVLLPATLISAVSAVLDLQSGRQQVRDQLESVATLKEAEINTWMTTLQNTLSVMLRERDIVEVAAPLLQGQLAPTDSKKVHDRLQEDWRQLAAQAGLFEQVFLMDVQGRVVLSTDAAQEGQDVSSQKYYREGIQRNYITPPFYYSPQDLRMSVVVARPIVAEQGPVGILAGRASIAALSDIMQERAGLGETGETYLVGADYNPLTALRTGGQNVPVRTDGTRAAVKDQVTGFGLYPGYRGTPVVGVYHWLPELQVALLAEKDQSEAFGPAYTTLGINVGVALTSALLAVLVALLITRSIASPLVNLARIATQIAAGDLERTADVKREDEIGALAQAFNRMTAQLRKLIGSLEQRVAERTADLERRSSYLAASAEVGRATTSILEIDLLISQAVELIRKWFGLYYVGLFLTDGAGEWAVLRAGTGEAGIKMLARGHQLRIGSGSMIGWSIANARARVALEAGADAVRLATAELPDTRSEAALPLRSRGKVIGALTVQSAQPGAFDQAAIAVLQTMADQVAVALDNARLYTESQAALEATRRAYGELSRQGWAELLRTRTEWSYRYAHRSVAPAEGDWRPEMLKAAQTGQSVQENGTGESTLAVPLKVRDQVVGVLHFCKGATGKVWTTEEEALLGTLADRLAQTLESARLYQDIQRRAAREQVIEQITAHMRETLDVETVLQTAVNEMYHALGLEEIAIRLATENAAN